MFKFIKIAVLFLIAIGLVACSSTPANVSKDVWNKSFEIVSEIDECFENECDFNDDVFLSYMDYMDYMIELDATDEEWELFEVVDDHFEILVSLTERKNTTKDDWKLLPYIVDYKNSFNDLSNILGIKKQYE